VADVDSGRSARFVGPGAHRHTPSRVGASLPRQPFLLDLSIDSRHGLHNRLVGSRLMRLSPSLGTSLRTRGDLLVDAKLFVGGRLLDARFLKGTTLRSFFASTGPSRKFLSSRSLRQKPRRLLLLQQLSNSALSALADVDRCGRTPQSYWHMREDRAVNA
jgi:hypothetical protein